MVQTAHTAEELQKTECEEQKCYRLPSRLPEWLLSTLARFIVTHPNVRVFHDVYDLERYLTNDENRPLFSSTRKMAQLFFAPGTPESLDIPEVGLKHVLAINVYYYDKSYSLVVYCLDNPDQPIQKQTFTYYAVMLPC
jgi:hypothetical protein